MFGALKTVVVWGLTFELSGGQRHGALAARCNMYLSTSRPGCHAVGRPLERRVRQRRVAHGEPGILGRVCPSATSTGSSSCKRLRQRPGRSLVQAPAAAVCKQGAYGRPLSLCRRCAPRQPGFPLGEKLATSSNSRGRRDSGQDAPLA